MLPTRSGTTATPQTNPIDATKPKVAPLRSRRPPSWLQCELCSRAASASRRLITMFAREDEGATAQPESLMLLCGDCCALVRGEIAEDEWHQRIAPR